MINRCCIILCLCALPASGGGGQVGTLILQFHGLADDRGQLVAALWDSAESWLSKKRDPHASHAGPILAGRASWRLENLAFGRYAVSAYHDRDLDGELDGGLFGIPSEDYGFSNDVRGGFGPPDFDAASFTFDRPGQTLLIRID